MGVRLSPALPFLGNQTGVSTMLTTSEIQRHFHNHDIIPLIKEYRERTGQGLKDSKDAIDKVFNHEIGDDRSFTNNRLANLLDLFANAKYVGANNPTIVRGATGLKVAIDIMYGNWNTLGYTSFKAGVQAIMSNF